MSCAVVGRRTLGIFSVCFEPLSRKATRASINDTRDQNLNNICGSFGNEVLDGLHVRWIMCEEYYAETTQKPSSGLVPEIELGVIKQGSR